MLPIIIIICICPRAAILNLNRRTTDPRHRKSLTDISYSDAEVWNFVDDACLNGDCVPVWPEGFAGFEGYLEPGDEWGWVGCHHCHREGGWWVQVWFGRPPSCSWCIWGAGLGGGRCLLGPWFGVGSFRPGVWVWAVRCVDKSVAGVVGEREVLHESRLEGW